MNFQVETDIRIFTEKIQEVFGSFVVIIERTVEYTHIFNTMLMNIIQTFADGFQWDGTDRLFAATDTECAGIEATSCRFQLYERFAPIKEAAFFGRYEIREFQYTCYSVVSVLPVGVEITESGNCIPLFLFVPACEPLWEHLFSFSSEYTADIKVLMQEIFIVSQILRTT